MDDKTIARFWSKVDKLGPVPSHAPELGPCWVWKGATHKSNMGHGSFRFDGKPQGAHRVAWFLEYGRWPTPNGCHRCNNPPCVRASHLYEGTQLQNMADRDALGRGRVPYTPGELHGAATLTDIAVRRIRKERARGIPIRDVARTHGICESTVSKITKRKRWAHIQ